ncbi:hypothetical protein L2E82_50292 [Cichorium intybus]|nr:hypothetical protein L2E82_50292 [Cichorium intybus]
MTSKYGLDRQDLPSVCSEKITLGNMGKLPRFHFEKHHHERIRGWVGFSVKTAHRITAGADILLMPSRFEPCGLNQMYAMTYGTVPVVHGVGGLRDTVPQFDPFNESGLRRTFHRVEASELIYALGNCLLTYQEYKRSWVGIQRRGMMQDLS